ncbi:MAG TPA: PAS domain-containing sensor histidine kinase, partial [Burkholderiaceae bacterium]|nr:PAS domain-containing sensor histidine kinase [Burkholderiaceae bacterium]
MEVPVAATARPSVARGRIERLLDRWWRRQSPARQDRFATLGPLVSVLLFLAAIISAFWYLRNEEFEREQEAVKRDAEISQQQMRLRLIENQEQLVRIAREVVTRAIDRDEFLGQAASFTRERPEVNFLAWVGADRRHRASYAADGASGAAGEPVEPLALALPRAEGLPEAEAAFVAARNQRQPAYSRPYVNAAGQHAFQVQVPLIDRSAFTGTLVAEVSIESLLRYFVPTDVTARHAVMLLDAQGAALASSVVPMPGITPRRSASIVQELPLAPGGN